MSAHTKICTPEYRKQMSENQRRQNDIKVKIEMAQYLRKRFDLLQNTIVNGQTDIGFVAVKKVYGELCKLLDSEMKEKNINKCLSVNAIQNEVNIFTFITFLNDNYFFYHMPKEYKELFYIETSRYCMGIVRYAINERREAAVDSFDYSAWTDGVGVSNGDGDGDDSNNSFDFDQFNQSREQWDQRSNGSDFSNRTDVNWEHLLRSTDNEDEDEDEFHWL